MKSPTANITGRPAALPAEMKRSISAPTADAACVRLAGTTDTPELIKYMCQMDYISIDMMGSVLYRTKTLATGGDCCDFHVVKKGSKMD